jgi:hypothetical protein
MSSRIRANQLKQALREALAEALLEQRQLFGEVFAEVLEDFAMVEAIRQGQDGPRTSRAEVFRLLQGKK